MAKRKVRLMQPQRLAPNTLHGAPLFPSAGVLAEYQQQWVGLVEEMHAEAWRALRGFAQDAPAAMDASDSPSFWQRVATLREQFERRFADVADAMATRMLDRVSASATSNVQRSIKELAPNFTVNFSDAAYVKDQFRERIDANVNLITRIPAEYMAKVTEDVQTAVLEGRGLNDLQRIMEERYGESKRWAAAVAKDQSNKAYRDVNTTRMREAGLRKFRWLHTSVPKQPRHYHKLNHDAGGLNGGVFELDNPPIIDQSTGQRGLPGDAHFCNCIMQPVIEV